MYGWKRMSTFTNVREPNAIGEKRRLLQMNDGEVDFRSQCVPQAAHNIKKI
jgi:hypothetical protein